MIRKIGCAAEAVVALAVACGPAMPHRPGTPNSDLIGASQGQVGPFVTPATWSQQAWYFDAQNFSGCASDNNRTCSISTCVAGDGPCKTFASYKMRLGMPSSASPIVVSPNTVHFYAMSNFADSDMVDLSPYPQGTWSPSTGIAMWLTCMLNTTNQAWTGTLGTVTPKSHATGQLLQTTFVTVGTPAVFQLLYNSTHPSYAWISTLSLTSPWTLSEPIIGCTPPQCAASMVDTWTSGDAITAYVPFTVQMSKALPDVAMNAYTHDQGQSVFIEGCQIPSPNGTDNSSFVANQYVQLWNVLSFRTQQDMFYAGNPGGPPGPKFANVYLDSLYRGIGGYWYGGIIGTGGKFATMVGGGYDGDVIFADSIYITGANSQVDEGGSTLNSVYLKQGTDIVNGFQFVKGPLWGPGELRAQAGAFVGYPTGANMAQATFLNNPGVGEPLRLNGDTHGCSAYGTGTQTINCGQIYVTPLNLDTCPASATAFCGKAFSLGGGQITNVFQ